MFDAIFKASNGLTFSFGYAAGVLWSITPLGDLPVGAYRYLTAEEIAELERLTAADTEKQGAGRSGASQNRS